MSINKLLRELDHSNVQKKYAIQGRLIPKDLWIKLKRKRICEYCHERFTEPLYIHHKVSVKDGGTNDESNLAVVCWSCHQKIDPPNTRDNDPKKRFNWWK